MFNRPTRNKLREAKPQPKPVIEDFDEEDDEPELTKFNTCPGCAKPMAFTNDQFKEVLDETLHQIKELSATKGSEYSGDVDRLANFRRNGEKNRLPMETIWLVYASKHFDSIVQYIVDQREGKDRKRTESISGRADDLIVYLLLFKCMLAEREAQSKHNHEVKSKPQIKSDNDSEPSWKGKSNSELTSDEKKAKMEYYKKKNGK